jgi:cell wall-associated NlpC family hydrolase
MCHTIQDTNGHQCCVSGGSAPPPTGGSGSGQSVVDKAVSQEGLPYVYGGGGCNGPSMGGYDCSGLTQYAICKSQGGKTIPRTANLQYNSPMGKHIPRAQAQAGDMLFWATGNCATSVKHVGIYKSPGVMVNAAKTGTPVREQSIWTSSGGLTICPDAVRFW